uniref:DUF4114 domain-containing protein n=1 Tax=Desertifilum tharense IPPAS B-1220 TaxID=1781255 RepID=A0ACD5GVI6_9CYAN
MKRHFFNGLLGTAATLAGVLAASAAQAFSPTASPLPSDLWSFFNQEFVQPERLEFQNTSAFKLDPMSLVFASGASPLEVFFINEGAGMRGSLFTKINGGTEQTVIQEISSRHSVLPEDDGVLELSQGWNLGKQAAGTKVEFLLSPWQGSDWRYGADPSKNPDGLQHIIAYQYQDWVILGFEDLFGELGATGGNNQNSDRDFNDVVIAIRGLAGTRIDQPPADVPEPSTMLALFGVGAFGALTRRRRSQES